MAQVSRSPKTYDVCIVGSGAGGGTAAKILTEGGLNVVMLEAGPNLNPVTDYKEHVWPYELPHRGAGVGGNSLQRGNSLESEFLAPNGAWSIEGEPYTTAPGSKFRWFRSRILGGRTNHWGLRNKGKYFQRSGWHFSASPRTTLPRNHRQEVV